MRSCFYNLILLVYPLISFGQHQTYKVPDSLRHAPLASIKQLAVSQEDTLLSKTYTQLWIEQAKFYVNWYELEKAYRHMLELNTSPNKILYTDSILIAANNSKNHNLLAKAYLTKGIYYYQKNELYTALHSYTKANELLYESNDAYNLHKTKYAIASIKFYLGHYEEALDLLDRCVSYFRVENDQAYLNSLHLVGQCYRNLGKLSMASRINLLGIQEGLAFENESMAPYFMLSEAIVQYRLNAFGKASEALTKLKNDSKYTLNNVAESQLNFYLGMSLWNLKEKDKAILYFFEVELKKSEHGILTTEIRQSLEMLLIYYQETNDYRAQLEYLNKLLLFDQELKTKHQYLAKTIFKEYDTYELLQEKEKISKHLNSRNSLLHIIVIFLVLLLLFVLYRYFILRKIHEKKFKLLMSKKEVDNKDNLQKNIRNTSPNIDSEIVQKVLNRLVVLESKNKFIDEDMNLHKLSSLLHTNTKYAALIILEYRGKKIPDYLNDLKVTYAIEQLKTDKKIRFYTIAAIASMAGFGSAQNFNKAFIKKTGIAPSYFIQQLEHTNQE